MVFPAKNKKHNLKLELTNYVPSFYVSYPAKAGQVVPITKNRDKLWFNSYFL